MGDLHAVAVRFPLDRQWRASRVGAAPAFDTRTTMRRAEPASSSGSVAKGCSRLRSRPRSVELETGQSLLEPPR